MINNYNLKQEEYQNNKYNGKLLSPKIEDIVNLVEPNKVETFAHSLKKQLRAFHHKHEEYAHSKKHKTKNLFEHTLILGTLRSPSKILEAYEEWGDRSTGNRFNRSFRVEQMGKTLTQLGRVLELIAIVRQGNSWPILS